jgi:hypothetical protein
MAREPVTGRRGEIYVRKDGEWLLASEIDGPDGER